MSVLLVALYFMITHGICGRLLSDDTFRTANQIRKLNIDALEDDYPDEYNNDEKELEKTNEIGAIDYLLIKGY